MYLALPVANIYINVPFCACVKVYRCACVNIQSARRLVVALPDPTLKYREGVRGQALVPLEFPNINVVGAAVCA